MLRDCFHCEHRVQGSSCPYFDDCMLAGVDHFSLRPKAKTRSDIIREMSDEDLSKFLLGFRPDVEKKIPNADELLKNWLSEEDRGKDFMNCWFFKVNVPDEEPFSEMDEQTHEFEEKNA